MNRAVILAGGSGTRINSATPKQFIELNGRPLLCYSLETFNNHPNIDDIILVVKQEYISQVSDIVDSYKYSKVSKIIAGGKERYESSLAAINECDDENDILLFHDSARPLVSFQIITRCINAMDKYNAVTVAIPTTDTIYVSDANHQLVSIPRRETLLNAQTPQCFRLSTIKEAFSLALSDSSFIATDDCSIVHKYIPSCPILIIKGEIRNFKVTYKEDIELVKKLLK